MHAQCATMRKKSLNIYSKIIGFQKESGGSPRLQSRDANPHVPSNRWMCDWMLYLARLGSLDE